MYGSGAAECLGRPLKCTPCDSWSPNYDYWLAHLVSDSHQQKVVSRPGNIHSHEYWREDSVKDCVLIVSGVKGLGLQQLLSYLSRWGIVIDLICQQDRVKGAVEYYYVKYDTPNEVTKVLTAQKRTPHQIQGRQIFFRRKYENSSDAQFQNINNAYRSQPHNYRTEPGRSSGIGLLASEYRDESESGLGVLQSTYEDNEDDEHENEEDQDQADPELQEGDSEMYDGEDQKHDLFSQKMTEYLATKLFDKKLEDQLEGFCKDILLSKPFLEARFKAIQELLSIIKSRYSKCTIYPCGVDYIGIGNSDDPINVFVDLFDNVLSSSKQPWETNPLQHLPQLYQLLKIQEDNGRCCFNVMKKSDEITFTHMVSQVKVSMKVTGYPVVQESMLIKCLCTLDPRVRPLLILGRYWAATTGILDNFPGNETTRGRLLMILMIFHLSNRNVIPPLAQLQSEPRNKIIFESMDLSFCTDTSRLPPPNLMLMQDKSIMTLSTLSLLQDFFQRFGVANLKENAVSLWLGKFVQKKHLNPANEHLLDENYAKKLRIGPNGEILMKSFDAQNDLFCVQDFFDMSLNHGSKLDAEEVKRFQMRAWQTGEKLEKVLNSGKPYLMDIFITSTEQLLLDQKQRQQKESAKQVQKQSQSQIQSHVARNYNQTSSNSSSAENNVGNRRESDGNQKPNMIREVQPRASHYRHYPSNATSDTKEDWLNIEWEEFSKSLEQPTTRPSSFLPTFQQQKPIAPIAPSPKSTNARMYEPPSQHNARMYDAPSQQNVRMNPALPPYNPPPPPPPPQLQPMYHQPQIQQHPYRGGNGGMSIGNPLGLAVTRPPVRYDGGSGMSSRPEGMALSRSRSIDAMPSDDEDDDSSDDSTTSESQDEKSPLIHEEHSRIRDPFRVKKLKLPVHLKNIFIEAVSSADLAYGIRGKLQTLFLQFMKEFNNRYWKNCFGFDIELDPTYQDTQPADYAKFGDRNSTKMSQLMNSVPCFEENYVSAFFCQSTDQLPTILTNCTMSQLRYGKFARKHTGHLLKVLMDESPGDFSRSNQNLRFKVEISIILDYSDLTKDCHPYVKIVFEKGLVTGSELLNFYQFFGTLYNRIAIKFLRYCYRRWLASCMDFDLQAMEKKANELKREKILRGETTNRKMRKRLKHLKKKEIKKRQKAVEASWAPSARSREIDQDCENYFCQREAESFRLSDDRDGRTAASYSQPQQQQRGNNNNNFRTPISNKSLLSGPGSSRGRNFQVPPSWNRSMDINAPVLRRPHN